MNRQSAAFIAGIMVLAGLIVAFIITLFQPDLEEDRRLLLISLTAIGAGAMQWFFRNGKEK